MARNGSFKHTQPSIQNGDDFIPFEQEASYRPSTSSNVQQRGVKRKASAMDDEDVRSRLRLHDRATPWMESMDAEKYETAVDLLNGEVEGFHNYVFPTDEEHSVRLMIVECIRTAITRRWPSAKVLPFGSQETQLYFPNGDIDLVVHYTDVSDNKGKIVTFLSEISRLLQKAQVSRRIILIAKARVPIIKFVTNLGHYAVDISVNQTNGVRAIGVVNRFLWYMPAVRPLVMVIKAFLLQRGLNEPFTGGFGSYTVICMVVSFLQMHPKVRRREIDPKRNLGVLLLDFLELYGRLFNYTEVGVSLRDGGSYFSRQQRGWIGADKYGSRMQISVEDPVDRDNDVSRSSSAGKVKDAFAAAFESLSTIVVVRAQELEARRTGSFVSLGNPEVRQTASLLGSIVGLPQDMLNFRREVHILYQGESLQRFLGLPPKGLWPPDNQKEEPVNSPPSEAPDASLSYTAEMGTDGEDEEKDELVVTVEAEHSPESRYDMDRKSRKQDDSGLVYEEDQSFSDMSLSPPAEGSTASTRLQDGITRLDRDARRAFWAAKGMGDDSRGASVESEEDRLENE